MDWLRAAFSGENSAITLVIIVVGLALALVLLAWVFRKIVGDGSLKAGRNRQPRLSVTDAAIVDDKRRLVLVRRDNVEHLVMIGGPTDIVIEQNIVRIAPVAVERAPARPPRPVAQPEPVHREQVVPQPMVQPQPVQAPQAHRGAEPVAAIVAAEAREPLAETFAEPEEQSQDAMANGHDVTQEVAEAAPPEIEIDLDELQKEIDRSQVAEDIAPTPKFAAPSLDAVETIAPQPARKQEARAPRVEISPEPEPRANRVKNMEDEMQRLLEELSGPARN